MRSQLLSDSDRNGSEGLAPQAFCLVKLGALGGTRTPNLLIRSQMLYPLSYERWCPDSLRHLVPRLCRAGHP